ncbi:MAG: phospholipid carrier-dependent glycosyltransferase [Chloroflexota bacterium]
MPTSIRYRWLATALLLLYFLAAVWMAFRLPAHATPNELLNFEYIQVMRQIGGLPNRGLVDSEVRYTEWHQPPVYFSFAALVGLLIPVPPSDVNPPPPIVVEENPHYLSTPRGNLNPVVHITPQTTPLLYTSRLAAALLGMLGIAALFRAGSRIVSPWVGLLMASIMAFQPGYLHLSGSVNNDMPLAATAALTMSYALLLLNRQRQQPNNPPPALLYVGLGLLGVLTILTKANGVFVLAFLGLVLLAGLLIYGRWGLTLKYAIATLVGLVPLWAGWLALNTVRMRDTLGLSGSLPVGRVLALSPADFAHVIPFLPQIWRSYWLDWSAGDVGYGPDWLYLFWLAAVVVALLGWVVRPAASAENSDPSFAGRLRTFLTSPTVLVLVGFAGISYLYFAVKALTVKEAGFLVPEGRWWLPGLPALAWLVAVGFSRWWRIPRRQEVACLAATAVPPVIAFGLLVFHLPALYPQATELTGGLPAGVEPVNITYGDSLILHGVSVAESAVIDEPVTATLYWEAAQPLTADLDISTQILVPDPGGWIKLAENNSYPGNGLNPTRGWQPGVIFRDDLTLIPSGELNGPTLASVQVGVSEQGDALAAQHNGVPVDPAVVSTLTIRPTEPLVPPQSLADPVVFGDLFRLVQVEIDPSTEGPAVVLWWESLQSTTTDYTVFVHLVDGNGNPVTQADGVPNSGLSPTTIWQNGDIIHDVHWFTPGQTVEPGWRVLVGVYDPTTGERLAATQAGISLDNAALSLDLPGAPVGP